MATAEVNNDLGMTRAKLIRWIGLAAVVVIGLIIVSRVTEALRQPAYNSTSTQTSATSEHCAHFIEVAKAAYGPDWKYRLDPRDTTCAAQVQQQWQYEWNARQPVQPLPSETLPISAPTAPIVNTSPTPVDSRIRNPETYCLNVISLARSRYGADWASRVTPEEAASCSDLIRGSASR